MYNNQKNTKEGNCMDPVLIVLLCVIVLLLILVIVSVATRGKKKKSAQTESDGKAENAVECKSESQETAKDSKPEEAGRVLSQGEVNGNPAETSETPPASEAETSETTPASEAETSETTPASEAETSETMPESEAETSETTPASEAAAAAAGAPSVGKDFSSIGKKVEKKPFYERVLDSEDDVRTYFNEIHNEFKSYRNVTARISKGYDSFRKNRELIARLYLSGKTLKLFVKLNSADYEMNKFHQQYVGNKKTYAEIPMMVKIRSVRALKNAKVLIADLMANEGTVKKSRYAKTDYLKTLKALMDND